MMRGSRVYRLSVPPALDIILPIFRQVPGWSAVEELALRAPAESDPLTVHIHTRSQHLRRVSGVWSSNDLAFRRATALLDGYSLTSDNRLPAVSVGAGGLDLFALEIASTHAHARPRGRTRDAAARNALLLGALASMLTNIGNDYLAPHLPGIQQQEIPEVQPEISELEYPPPVTIEIQRDGAATTVVILPRPQRLSGSSNSGASESHVEVEVGMQDGSTVRIRSFTN